MKAKNQQHFTSEVEARDKLIIFVYEYLIHSGAKQAADEFVKNINYQKNIEIKEGPGFLLEWWCVFWDLYCATPDRRHLQPASSNEARAYQDYMRSNPMSPSISQKSPLQQQQNPPQFIGPSPRHHGPPQHSHPRGPPPPRMQGPPPMHQHGGPPVPHGGFVPTSNPRYAQHACPPQPHMNQSGPLTPVVSYGPGPDQMNQGRVMNRMSSVSGPPQQLVGPSGPGGSSIVGVSQNQQPPPMLPSQGSSQVNTMQSSGPPPLRSGSQGGWQGNFNLNSPAEPQCFMPPGPTNSDHGVQEFSGMMIGDNTGMIEMKPTSNAVNNNNNGNSNNNNISNTNNNNESNVNGPSLDQAQQQQDEYVMPGAYGQQSTDQGGDAGSEIRKLKESLESDANEGEQQGFGIDFNDGQGKW